MSYKKMMKWHKTHPKGTRQPVLFHTNSGFWPSGAWLRDCFWPYEKACELAGVAAMECEAFYRKTSARGHFHRHPQDYAAMTKAGTL